MKNMTCLALSCAALLCNITAARGGALEELRKSGLAFGETDLYRIKESWNAWGQAGSAIWPGVKAEEIPLVVVYSAKEDIVIGHPNPPVGCLPLKEPLPIIERLACRMPDRTFMNGMMAGNLNGAQAVYFNTWDEYNTFVRNYAKGDPKMAALSNYSRPFSEYMAVLAHESFHVYQNQERKLLPKRPDEKPENMSKADYPYLDLEINALLGVEGRILSKLMTEKEPQRIRRLWKDFSEVRNARRAKLAPFMVKIEKHMELTEGTAQYVQFKLQYGGLNSVKPLPQTEKDPAFTSYVSTQTFESMVDPYLVNIATPTMTKFATFTYYTGAALANNLDSLKPGWKKDFFRKYRSLDDILAEVLPAADGKKELAQALARNNYTGIKATLEPAYKAAAGTNLAAITAFKNGKGHKYLIAFEKAKAKDIQIPAPGLMSDYKDERLYEAGVQSLMFTDANLDSLTQVDFLKPIKVLFNFSTATSEIIVPKELQSELKIEAKEKKISRGKTVYRGGVSCENGIWSWKGEKLEVSEKDGQTTLRFYASPKKP